MYDKGIPYKDAFIIYTSYIRQFEINPNSHRTCYIFNPYLSWDIGIHNQVNHISYINK